MQQWVDVYTTYMGAEVHLAILVVARAGEQVVQYIHWIHEGVVQMVITDL